MLDTMEPDCSYVRQNCSRVEGESWLLARRTGRPYDGQVRANELIRQGRYQVMFVPSRRRRTNFCGAGQRRFSVVDSRCVVRTLEVCLLLVLTCSCAAAFESDRSITQFVHTAWSAKEGAPNVVGELAQTSDGYIWLGTPNGLYRFDGVAFEHYLPQSGGPFPE